MPATPLPDEHERHAAAGDARFRRLVQRMERHMGTLGADDARALARDIRAMTDWHATNHDQARRIARGSGLLRTLANTMAVTPWVERQLAQLAAEQNWTLLREAA